MFNVIALAAIVGCAVLASKLSDEEIRQKFLADHAEKPGFKYLKKKALDAQKKQTVQRKKTSGPQVSPDVKKYVEELQAKAIKQRGPESLQQINKPLANFLYQGDMLLTQAQAVLENFTDAGKQRRAGPVAKFNDGSTMERPKWPHDSPICYKFQPGSDPWTKELMRKAAQYWTENTCLTWKEGCTGKPTVMIHTNGDGCYTTPGRGFGQVSISTRGSQRTYSPVFDDEQEMSLASPGCDWLATTLHEASHVMGQAHEQSRPDRDDAIDVIWDNIDADWKAQYAKADGSQVYDIPYDYQSNMQYTGYANDPKVDMAAKERIYQHTMGSRTGVVFNDLKFLNIYNDCMCKSGASCQNGGFPHPRKCNECICPDGFGGTTCTERQQGEGDAPSGCGATVNANSNWQSLEVSVPAPKGVGPYDGTPDSKIANDRSCCTWWIKGNVQFESHTPGSINECRNDCVYGGTDVKFNDITRGGARICCPEPVQEFGTVTSTSDLMIVRVCSIRNSQKSMIKFRTTDTQGPPGKPVPPRAGVAPSPPSGDGSPPVVGGGGVGGGGSCVDAIGAQKCAQFKEICGDSDPVSQKQMKTICAKTCNLCGGSSEVGGSGGSGGCNDSDAICAIAKRNPSACDGPALGEMFKSSCPCTCPSG